MYNIDTMAGKSVNREIRNENRVVTGLPKRDPVKKLDNQMSKVKRRIFKHVWLVRGLILAGILGVLMLLMGIVFFLVSRTFLWQYKDMADSFVFPKSGEILAENSGRTNLLLLGRSGEGHDSPLLTDTIMVASINNSENSVNLISLPRDIWLPDMKAKLNSAYYWGEKQKPGAGIALVDSKVEDILGIPIHYTAIIDFDSFVEIIDTLGGVQVDVQTPFVDSKYPIAGKENDECNGDPEYGCRYQTIEFSEGLQYMDGTTALKFSRSRSAEGDEGTDIARAARQQLVLEAIKNKMTTREVWTSLPTLEKLTDIVFNSIETDLSREQMAKVARYFYDAQGNISSHVLPEDLLVNPKPSAEQDFLYVFIPAGDDPATPDYEWDNVHKWASMVLNQ